MEKKTIDISLNTIIRECSLDQNLSFDHFNNVALINRDNIHDVFRYRKFNNDFVSKLSCYCDDDHFIGKIRPSYDHFLSSLEDILNIKDKSLDDNDDLTKTLMDRVTILKNIKTMEQLYKEFPILYYDLIDGRKYYKDLQKFKDKGKYEEQEYQAGEHYYYSCGLKRSLENFVQTQSTMYERYINKRHELKEKYKKTSYNPYFNNKLNINKLAMYVVHEYLLACESSTDKKEIQEYLNKINMYLKDSKYDKSVKITTDAGILIDINNIKNRLNTILNRNSKSIVPWILIPKGRNYNQVYQKNSKPRTTLFNYKEVEQLKKTGQDRNNYYEGTNYIAKVIGIGTCKGYVGYIYSNGEVILDREYDEERPYTAKGNAIYNIRVENFETLTKLNKRSLMKTKKAKKICHVNGWEDKINNIIEREATELDKENTSKLLKKLKRVK